MKNFIINFIICFLASIAIADTHDVPLVEGVKLLEFFPSGVPIDLNKSGIVFRQVWSPLKWKLVLFCESDNLSNDINCYWSVRSTLSPISTQPAVKTLFLSSRAKQNPDKQIYTRSIDHRNLTLTKLIHRSCQPTTPTTLR
ncbi:uncharacterized protein EAE97_010559 [Botrytis byssoidea]|uniref:Uncharacterized protein n=1 Tax=Botrytis byssoidea TaxID=139641 RepID=A0A9P5LWA5_9HELO|nr:uncharacterized protein EAE97_010559 [Botrytis byssoidea]KAF7925478.1 hypothetical protein EAE97_010559 [Botrytis byssoidea]